MCEDDEDVRKSTTTRFSLKEVYDSWIKGGHTGNKWYGYTDYGTSNGSIAAWLNANEANGKHPNTYSELTGTMPTGTTWTSPNTDVFTGYGYPFWTYNNVNQSIMQVLNCGDYSFYVSPVDYLNYDITFDIKSYDSDDDVIGFIAAMNIDPNTKLPHILCFNRSSCNSNFIYDNIQPAFHWYC